MRIPLLCHHHHNPKLLIRSATKYGWLVFQIWSSYQTSELILIDKETNDNIIALIACDRSAELQPEPRFFQIARLGFQISAGQGMLIQPAGRKPQGHAPRVHLQR